MEMLGLDYICGNGCPDLEKGMGPCPSTELESSCAAGANEEIRSGSLGLCVDGWGLLLIVVWVCAYQREPGAKVNVGQIQKALRKAGGVLWRRLSWGGNFRRNAIFDRESYWKGIHSVMVR